MAMCETLVCHKENISMNKYVFLIFQIFPPALWLCVASGLGAR